MAGIPWESGVTLPGHLFPKRRGGRTKFLTEELFGKGGRHLAVFGCDGKGPRAE